MSILYKKVWRFLNPLDKKSIKKVYPVITISMVWRWI